MSKAIKNWEQEMLSSLYNATLEVNMQSNEREIIKQAKNKFEQGHNAHETLSWLNLEFHQLEMTNFHFSEAAQQIVRKTAASFSAVSSMSAQAGIYPYLQTQVPLILDENELNKIWQMENITEEDKAELVKKERQADVKSLFGIFLVFSFVGGFLACSYFNSILIGVVSALVLISCFLLVYLTAYKKK